MKRVYTGWVDEEWKQDFQAPSPRYEASVPHIHDRSLYDGMKKIKITIEEL